MVLVQVVDVTWRYTDYPKDVLKRRTECSESWLASTLCSMTEKVAFSAPHILDTFRDEYEYKISSARALIQQTRCQENEISNKSRPLNNEFAGKSVRTLKSCTRIRI